MLALTGDHFNPAMMQPPPQHQPLSEHTNREACGPLMHLGNSLLSSGLPLGFFGYPGHCPVLCSISVQVVDEIELQRREAEQLKRLQLKRRRARQQPFLYSRRRAEGRGGRPKQRSSSTTVRKPSATPRRKTGALLYRRKVHLLASCRVLHFHVIWSPGSPLAMKLLIPSPFPHLQPPTSPNIFQWETWHFSAEKTMSTQQSSCFCWIVADKMFLVPVRIDKFRVWVHCFFALR